WRSDIGRVGDAVGSDAGGGEASGAAASIETAGASASVAVSESVRLSGGRGRDVMGVDLDYWSPGDAGEVVCGATLTTVTRSEKAGGRIIRPEAAASLSLSCGSAGGRGVDLDVGGRSVAALLLDPVDLAIRLFGLAEIDAELRQRDCGEQCDEADHHFDQGLHGTHNDRSRFRRQCGELKERRH